MEHCPQCGADLECFELLEDLQEPANRENPRRAGKGGFSFLPGTGCFMFVLLSVILIGLVSASVYLGMRMGQLTDRLERHVAAGEVTNTRAARSEEDGFAERIANFDRQRLLAKQRIEAALAKYGAKTSVESR
jgi:hypothetical protein